MPLWKRLLIIGASAGAGFALMLTLIGGAVLWYSSRPKPAKPWNTSVQSEQDRLCEKAWDSKHKGERPGVPEGEEDMFDVSVFYSRKLETCVEASGLKIGNSFVIHDVTRGFLRIGAREVHDNATSEFVTSENVGASVLFQCEQDGVANVLIDRVRQHHGLVYGVPYSEFMDDYNGGLPSTNHTPSHSFTREECARLFERKLSELR
jgi:hypothetical protein